MDRHPTSEERGPDTRPAPGNPALLRHLTIVESAERAPQRTWRDVVGDDGWEGRSVDRLVCVVGGVDALDSLDSAPLPADEPFDPIDIERNDLPAVQAVLAALHDRLPTWLQGEYVTVLHRLVARAARHGLTTWHRDQRRMAAAFVWLALGGNASLGRGREVRAQDIWRWYAVNDCRALARCLCVEAQLGSIDLTDDDRAALSDLHVVFGDVALLHSSFRAFLLDQRKVVERLMVASDERRSSRRPVQWAGDGQISFRARQVRALWAFKAPSTTGRSSVMVALGRDTDDDDYELIGLSVPDARELIAMLQAALDAPASGTMSGVKSDRTHP